MPATLPDTGTRAARLEVVQGWLVVALLTVMSVINSAGAVPGTRWFPLFIPLCGIVLVTGLVIWLVRDRSVAVMVQSVAWPAWVCIGATTAMFAYAFGSAVVTRSQIWVGKAHTVTDVPTTLTALPPLEGLLAALTAFVTVGATSPHRRFALIWNMSAALVPLSLIGWFRVWWNNGSPRLWTQVGGAAVYPVVLLIGFAVAVAAVLRPHRPKISQALALCHIALMFLTGSRGALLMLAIFGVIAFVRLGREHTLLGERLAKRSRLIYVVGGVAVTIAAFTSPLLSRIGQGSPDRLLTWKIGWDAVSTGWHHIVFGIGYGKLWPWFAYESGWQKVPYRSIITGPYGTTLYHSHSLYLGVLVELGLVGVLLLALVVLPIAVQWFRGGSISNMVLSSAACACLVGFAFDTYLFKNFPVSFVWWIIAIAVLTTAHQPWLSSPSPGDGPPTDSPATEPPDGDSATTEVTETDSPGTEGSSDPDPVARR